MSCGMCAMRTGMNPDLAQQKIVNSFAVRSMSGLTGASEMGLERRRYPERPVRGVRMTNPNPRIPGHVTLPRQSRALDRTGLDDVGSVNLAGLGGLGFDWQGLINQGFDFGKTLITYRPAAGTVITTSPTGGVQVARQTEGAPINYGATNTMIGGNLGGQLGVATSGLNSNMLLIGGAVLVAFMLMRR